MFTDNENNLAKANDGLPFGHDPYLDARKAIYATYVAFVEGPTMKSLKVIRPRQDGKKSFRSVSSFDKGYCPTLFITPLGAAVVELHYVDTDGPPSLQAHQCIEYIDSHNDVLVTNTRGTNEMIDILLNLLKRNTCLLEDSTPVHIEGVRLQRSFFVPIYPKELRTTSRRPMTSRSAFMDELHNWRMKFTIGTETT
jgi:hypothetical protein